MSDPIAFHCIFGTYGSWLPNDPRGSRSTLVWANRLRPFGRATFTEEISSVARVPHDKALWEAAKRALLDPPVVFDGLQAWSVGQGFRKQVATSGYVIHACAILPCHTHMVIARHHYSIKQVRRLLKQAATARLLADGRHPFVDMRDENGELPSAWSENGWDVHLDTEEEVAEAIAYVEDNPSKEGKPRQKWSFVTSFQ